MKQLIATADQITPEWLAAVMGADDVSDVEVTPIGTGQMSRSLRVTYRVGDRDGRVIVKLAATDPDSRATGVGLGAYSREVNFYRERGGTPAGVVSACHLAEFDGTAGWFTLVLDDAFPAQVGDQIAGCGPDVARQALVSLAQIQAPVLGDPVLGAADWLNQPNPLTQALYEHVLPGFLERYADRIAPEHREVCEAFGDRVDVWLADRRAPLGLVHGDYRLDNLLFTGDRCTVVDWQTVTWGSAMLDVAYFLGGSLSTEDRRAHEEDLVRGYHDSLVAAGGHGLTWERGYAEYRRQAFFGILMAVVASMIVERTDRGDDMFMAVLGRHAQHVLDVGALDLLPAAGTTTAEALTPNPADEDRHEPGPEDIWNESWYFDAVSDDGAIGVYLRLGCLPNQGGCVYAVSVCGPGRPSVMLVLENGPLPDPADPAQTIDAPTLHAEHHLEESLQRFRVTLHGEGAAHADPSAPLRGEAGAPVAVALDLSWETDGIPYAWRQATRYEIPCRVTGTIRVGDEEITFAGPGQRDHSWGVRDWWAVDWMWSALHLDDGTRLHAVGAPELPALGVGYVQAGGELTEVTGVKATQNVAADGLISDAVIELAPQELRLAVEPVAFGALRLEALDGRVSHFPRALCRVSTDDGRQGTGWVEWNRVQR